MRRRMGRRRRWYAVVLVICLALVGVAGTSAQEEESAFAGTPPQTPTTETTCVPPDENDDTPFASEGHPWQQIFPTNGASFSGSFVTPERPYIGWRVGALCPEGDEDWFFFRLARGRPEPSRFLELLAHAQLFPDPYSGADPSGLWMQVFRLASGSPSYGGELEDPIRVFVDGRPHPYARIAIDDFGQFGLEHIFIRVYSPRSTYTGSYVLFISGGDDNCCAPPPTGHIRVCKQAGDGVAVGRPFSFRVPMPGEYDLPPPPDLALTVPAGSCSEPIGPRPLHPLTVTEDRPPGVETLGVATMPPDRLLASDPGGGSALVQVGPAMSGVGVDENHLTDVTFTNGTRPADLSVDKACTAGPVAPGEVVQCSVTVTNAGPSPAQAVSVTDDLPPNLSLVGVTSDGGFTCGPGDPFTCTMATLPPGSATFAFDARLSPDAPPGSVTNMVTVSAASHDPSPGNNVDSASTSVLALPTLTTRASPGGPLPATLSDTATLSGGLDPTGTITFRVFGPDDAPCSGPAAATFTATVTGNGEYTSGAFAPTAPGVYRWTADYSGNAGNRAASSACNAPNETATVTKAAPGLGTQASTGALMTATTPWPSLRDTATLTGGFAPTGTLTFRLHGPDDAACTRPPVFSATEAVNGNGSYTSDDYTPAEVGVYRWVVDYSGDANNLPATSPCNAPNESAEVTLVCAAPPPPGTLPGNTIVIAAPGLVTTGTSDDDVIYGTPGDDRISGAGGDDVIFGAGGNDQIAGGDGADTLCGGGGRDRLGGGAGDDLLAGDAGEDLLSGGDGDDRLINGTGTDDIGVFRPSSGTWFVEGGPTVAWGTSGDVPVPADYDGDGNDDIAVFRPSSGTWFVEGGPTVAWGTSGDLPVPVAAHEDTAVS